MQIQTMVGWNVTDMVGSGFVAANRTLKGSMYINTTDMMELNSAAYWAAPTQYTGSRVGEACQSLTHSVCMHDGCSILWD